MNDPLLTVIGFISLFENFVLLFIFFFLLNVFLCFGTALTGFVVWSISLGRGGYPKPGIRLLTVAIRIIRTLRLFREPGALSTGHQCGVRVQALRHLVAYNVHKSFEHGLQTKQIQLPYHNVVCACSHIIII